MHGGLLGRNWSGRERDTDGHTDLGTQLEGTKREATARAVPPRTDDYERNMKNGKDREEKESDPLFGAIKLVLRELGANQMLV
ncbi:hypothetical protein PRIPAC_89935 [Pristionchus pacificus]|uniref:Uncharacterized protein n=1 Tax=Pristionchus pacificus TaxID=54126 RepID=A0A2A6CYD4_PRIPA|nr:hypothetical protein PRIPAC_89935 [Pristionchus pacificus]|eukprot:PDM83077.1 hypothetical protein PRIPAC_37470 [Pristionchus pacificus]